MGLLRGNASATLSGIGNIRHEHAIMIRSGDEGHRVGFSKQFLSEASCSLMGRLSHEEEKIHSPRLTDAFLVTGKNLLLLALRKPLHGVTERGRDFPQSLACDHIPPGIKTVDLGFWTGHGKGIPEAG